MVAHVGQVVEAGLLEVLVGVERLGVADLSHLVLLDLPVGASVGAGDGGVLVEALGGGVESLRLTGRRLEIALLGDDDQVEGSLLLLLGRALEEGKPAGGAVPPVLLPVPPPGVDSKVVWPPDVEGVLPVLVGGMRHLGPSPLPLSKGYDLGGGGDGELSLLAGLADVHRDVGGDALDEGWTRLVALWEPSLHSALSLVSRSLAGAVGGVVRRGADDGVALVNQLANSVLAKLEVGGGEDVAAEEASEGDGLGAAAHADEGPRIPVLRELDDKEVSVLHEDKAHPVGVL